MIALRMVVCNVIILWSFEPVGLDIISNNNIEMHDLKVKKNKREEYLIFLLIFVMPFCMNKRRIMNQYFHISWSKADKVHYNRKVCNRVTQFVCST